MSLSYDFKKALRTIEGMSAQDRRSLAAVCEALRRAEAALNRQAASLLRKCISSCEGICCRNIRLEEVIGFYDFVYLLAVQGCAADDIAARLKKESMFSGDCVFLKNGKGPCIFPEDARPRICIVTFCADDAPVKPQIQEVNRRFDAIADFLLSRRLGSMAKYLPLRFFRKPDANSW